MKVFVALTLLSVALANPMVRPVILPEAPLPAIETMSYIPMAVLMDIKSQSQDVTDVEKLTDFELDIPSDAGAVNVVEVAEYNESEPAASHVGEIPAEPVKFVDVAENQEVPVADSKIVETLVAAVAEEIPAEAVKIVDIAENNEPEPVAPFAVDIPAEPVKIVDVAENHVVPVAASEIETLVAAVAEPVKVVEVAENDMTPVAVREVAKSAVVAPIAASKVAALVEQIEAEAVRVVEQAENIEAVPVAPRVEPIDKVRVVDSPPRYPGKTFDNPMLR